MAPLPMKSQSTFKCLHCNEIHCADARNRGRQQYCPAPDCRRAAKADSQRRWLGRPENENYFRGAENSRRVQLWRKAHPGYWRKKTPEPAAALQDSREAPAEAPAIEDEPLEPIPPPVALQDVWFKQPALIVGLIAILTGHALQEDIAMTIRTMLDRGEDILRLMPGSSPSSNHENSPHPRPGTAAARASPVQLDRPSTGARPAYSGSVA